MCAQKETTVTKIDQLLLAMDRLSAAIENLLADESERRLEAHAGSLRGVAGSGDNVS